jgi:hypothetical protein
VAAYFGIAVAVDTWTLGGTYERQGIDLRIAYGAYVGLTGVIIALLAAGLLARGESTPGTDPPAGTLWWFPSWDCSWR